MGKFSLADHIQKAQPPQVRDIEIITREVLDAKQAEGEAILVLGNKLIEAKAQLTHGEWLEWLERVDIKPRVAQRHMMLAQKYSNASTLTYLGASKALELLAIPDETEREMYIEAPHIVNGEEKLVGDMSVRELRTALKERDEALKAAEQAKAEQAAAEQAREKMAADMALANERIEGLNAQIDEQLAQGRKWQTEIARLEADLSELKSRPVEVAVQADESAVEAARKEAEARMRAQLDEAKAAQEKVRAELMEANSALQRARLEREQTEIELRKQIEQAEKKAALTANEDFVIFKTIFEQVQEGGNKLCGLVMKARNKDQKLADGFSSAFLNWLDKMRKEVAQ